MPGSHGSLTKAGKVRQLTPKVPRTGVNSRSKKIPRIRNNVLYEKRVVRQRYAGQQNSINAQKHNRKVQNKR